ncbi:hypothetical protein LCM10_16900 [Rossellomorea aquimaris]|uniref:hypothetical protein n=1 Tax=Rossellomorea aquimaris TaxID=189382 RepID=UPI001CD30F5C|nr:hypothetical protein [Rossellomorea aquimaris]MCA1056664.1 hypothetical protein [Rossellomorea aquimaris]
MILVFLLFYTFLGWRFGNWKEFPTFYPTMLFFIIGDLLSQFLLFDYPMWKFQSSDFISQSLHLNHTIIALLKMLIQYTSTVAIFIGRLPDTLPKKILWVLLWSGIYAITEGMTYAFGIMTYHHGWHFGWDLVFTVMMFTMLIIHHKNPILAWAASLPIIIALWVIFDIPYSVLK